jgi:hypothetical protein
MEFLDPGHGEMLGFTAQTLQHLPFILQFNIHCESESLFFKCNILFIGNIIYPAFHFTYITNRNEAEIP